MRVARRFVVRGRVQGVGFRWFVQELADGEGAVGWVRNTADGCVEALVQGDAEAVLRIDRLIRRGPPAARVERVDSTEESAVDRLSGFVIRD